MPSHTVVGADTVSRLREGELRAEAITRLHGTTYYWGTRFLPPEQRRDVYGIYALCRLADDIVDEPDAAATIALDVPDSATPGMRLEAFERRFADARTAGDDPDPLMLAIVDTTRRLELDESCYERFFGAMRLDLTRSTYPTWTALRDDYMEGSAAVIGEMMLPVLRPTTDDAKEPARALGIAFQLTNFIRDVGEDLDRGRVYLPADELAAAGADPWSRRVTPAWRSFLAGQIARNREVYAQAQPGLAMLPPGARRCVGAALVMYSRILTEVERADYDVFSGRLRVHTMRKGLLASRVALTGTAAMAPALAQPAAKATTREAIARRVPPKLLPQPGPAQLRSTWRQAAVPRIERALRLALEQDPGGWYVAGQSRGIGAGRPSVVRTVAGREIALWRTGTGELRAGPGACPHMGARLEGCAVLGDDIACRWHGLRLPSEWPGGWDALPAYDDGALAWVRLPTAGEVERPAPRLPARPALTGALVSVHARAAYCEPLDIVANRLDPWHGAWLHPYAFSHLVVDEAASDDRCLVTDVTFRLDRWLGVPVRAEFTCPDARTIVMTITDGEGAGSVVETHATPVVTAGPGADGAPGRLPRTVMTEVTIATSGRPGFQLARAVAPLVRPAMERTQARLWVDDLAYAERRYAVRAGLVRT